MLKFGLEQLARYECLEQPLKAWPCAGPAKVSPWRTLHALFQGSEWFRMVTLIANSSSVHTLQTQLHTAQSWQSKQDCRAIEGVAALQCPQCFCLTLLDSKPRFLMVRVQRTSRTRCHDVSCIVCHSLFYHVLSFVAPFGTFQL